MNTEQIEKLALQCGAWHQVYGNRYFMIDEHFDINKFTKLVVRECVWAFGETRTEPSLEKYILDRLGVK